MNRIAYLILAVAYFCGCNSPNPAGELWGATRTAGGSDATPNPDAADHVLRTMSDWPEADPEAFGLDTRPAPHDQFVKFTTDPQGNIDALLRDGMRIEHKQLMRGGAARRIATIGVTFRVGGEPMASTMRAVAALTILDSLKLLGACGPSVK